MVSASVAGKLGNRSGITRNRSNTTPSMKRSTTSEPKAAVTLTGSILLNASGRANSPTRPGRMLFAMNPIETPANRERSRVSAFIGVSRTFQRRARIKKPKVATNTDAASNRKLPLAICARTSAKSTSRRTHQSAKTVTVIPMMALAHVFIPHVPESGSRPCHAPPLPFR